MNAAEFWSAVDCALSTSDNEGMPVALIEAQLAGIPVITTNVGSSSEVIENEITGLVTTTDKVDLIQAVKKIVNNNTLLQKMGDEAKSWARKNFSVEKMTNSHVKLYSELLRSR